MGFPPQAPIFEEPVKRHQVNEDVPPNAHEDFGVALEVQPFLKMLIF